MSLKPSQGILKTTQSQSESLQQEFFLLLLLLLYEEANKPPASSSPAQPLPPQYHSRQAGYWLTSSVPLHPPPSTPAHQQGANKDRGSLKLHLSEWDSNIVIVIVIIIIIIVTAVTKKLFSIYKVLL
jgi:hypothetical protein